MIARRSILRLSVASVLSVLTGVTFVLSNGVAATGLPTELDYRAPPVCPNEVDFRARLQAALSGASSKASRSIRGFSVVILADPRGFIARVTTRETDGSRSEREVVGPTCAEVFEGVQLLCAVALGLEPQPSPMAGPSALPTTSASAVRPVAPPPPTAVARSNESGGSRGDRTRHVSFGLEALGTKNIASPSVRPGVRAFAELGWTSAGLGGFVLRLGGLWTSSETMSVPVDANASATGIATTGEARVDVWSSDLDGCPLRIGGTGVFGIRPCLGVQLGVMRASSQKVVGALDRSRLWLGLVPNLRFEWIPTPIVSLSFGLSATLAIARHRFYFEPDSTIYDMPFVGGIASLGLAVRGL